MSDKKELSMDELSNVSGGQHPSFFGGDKSSESKTWCKYCHDFTKNSGNFCSVCGAEKDAPGWLQ